MNRFWVTSVALVSTLSMAPLAGATSATIDFGSCSAVRLSHAGTNCSNLPGSATYMLYTWTQDANTVSAVSGNQSTSTTQTTNTIWQWTTTAGNPEPGLKQNPRPYWLRRTHFR